jgi:hypothetical protein
MSSTSSWRCSLRSRPMTMPRQVVICAPACMLKPLHPTILEKEPRQALGFFMQWRCRPITMPRQAVICTCMHG